MARSGGHQYCGLSSLPQSSKTSIQVDMRNFTSITTEEDAKYNILENKDRSKDAYKVTMGVGVRIRELYQVLNSHNLFVPGGVCGSVCVGGHFQSSAMGILMKSFGLGLDYVTRIKMVLSSGEIVIATPTEYGDLFWAVLGGSPGAFGIVVEYEINALNSLSYEHAFAVRHFWDYTNETFRDVVDKKFQITQHPAYQKLNDFIAYITIGPHISNPYLSTSCKTPSERHMISLVLVWTGVDSGSIYNSIPSNLLCGNLSAGTTFYSHFVGPFNNIAGIKSGMSSEFEYQQDNDHTLSHILGHLMVPDFVGNLKSNWNDTKRMIKFQEAEEIENKALKMARDDGVKNIDEEMARYSVAAGCTTGSFDISFFVDQVTDRLRALHDNPHLYCVFQISDMGIKDADSRINAFPLRNVKFAYDAWVIWRESPGSDTAEDAIGWAKQTKVDIDAALGNNTCSFMLSTNGNLDIHDPVVQSRYYPDKSIFERLQCIKRCYDPQDIFKTKFTVPPAVDNFILDKKCPPLSFYSQRPYTLLLILIA
eukprot:scaffold18423_cov67-Attheya_sp.AAC.2